MYPEDHSGCFRTGDRIAASTVVLIWLYGDWLMAKAYKITLEGPSRTASLRIDRVIETLENGPGRATLPVAKRGLM